MATEKPRFSVTFTERSFKEIQDYQRGNNISTQSKAVAKLVEIALNKIETESGEKNFLSSVEIVSEKLSKKEQTHIKKYRFLDQNWKEAVDSVLDIGYRCCEETKQANFAKAKAQREKMEAAEEISPEIHKIIDLPFDELKASAGAGYQLDEDRMTIWKVQLNDLTRKADFCLEVDGKSMEPIIRDGDIILVRQQPAVDVGEIGLFTVDDKGFVKKQGKDRLISVNKKFEDIFPNEYDTVFCRGKVIGVLDPEWIVER